MLEKRKEHGHIPFEGIHNFRDLGGYLTTDQKRVKRGLIYRSGHLAAYTDADLMQLEKMKLSTILDFRTKEEINKHPDPTISNVRYLHIPAMGEDRINADMKSVAKLDPDTMLAFYKEVPIQNASYRELFRMLLDGKGMPILMHCTGGKDRTGGAAALILLTLGVPMDTVMEDFLVSNIYLEDFVDQMMAVYSMMMDDHELDMLRYMFSAREEFLHITMERIAEVYGDFDTYLREDIGISPEDQARLRAMYLE